LFLRVCHGALFPPEPDAQYAPSHRMGPQSDGFEVLTKPLQTVIEPAA
jgi:hypothetical protein